MIEPRDFLEALYVDLRDDERIELRAIEEGKCGKVIDRQFISLAPLVEKLSSLPGRQQRDGERSVAIYFGVAPRRGNVGTKHGVKRVTAIWGDFDSKESAAKLSEFPISPSAVVASGGAPWKRHAYWLLDEPDEDVLLAERVMIGIKNFLGGDHVWNRDHIMRLPGTLNCKNGEQHPCELIEFHPERRYSLSDFEDFIAQGEPIDQHATVGDIPNELPERFCKLLDAPENDQLIAAWNGTRKPKTDRSRSGFDLMMAALCIRHGLSDTETASVLLNYGHGRGKDGTLDYIQRTIGTARTGLEKQRTARTAHALIQRAADVERETVSWLWPGRIPLAKISLIDGDPDLGKTLVSNDLTARITRGDVMPDGSPGLGQPANVIIASAEDDEADTMRPRLEAAGADLGRVFFVTGVATAEGKQAPLSFPASIDALRGAIEETNAVLAILDPLLAFVGSATDAHKDDSIRRGMMSPLKALAEEARTAILGIRHLNKSQLGRAIHRGGGSVAIVAAVRSAMLIAPAPDDPDLRVLAVVKSNLARRAPSLTYRIVSLHDDPTVPRIHWEGELDVSADELLAAASEDKGAVDEAKDFLRDILDESPVMATKIYSAAKVQHISERTLKRAKKALGVKSRRAGNEGWYWSLSP